MSLLFAPGARPRADDVARLATAGGRYAISHRPDGAADWLELLINGLTFDLTGLQPGAAAPDGDSFAHRYALPEDVALSALEALALAPGPHLAGGAAMLPIVRGAAALATALAELPGIAAVGWMPARALSAAGHFRNVVGAWLAGGVFPALGLTGLARERDGGMRSEGLGFLIGQELRLEPGGGTSAAEDARLAVRLIDRLVATGAVREAQRVEPLPGVTVELEPDREAGLVRAWRTAR